MEAKDILYSNEEIEHLLCEGLVMEMLIERYQKILSDLHDEARKQIASLSSKDRRAILGARVANPNLNLSDLLRRGSVSRSCPSWVKGVK